MDCCIIDQYKITPSAYDLMLHVYKENYKAADAAAILERDMKHSKCLLLSEGNSSAAVLVTEDWDKYLPGSVRIKRILLRLEQNNPASICRVVRAAALFCADQKKEWLLISTNRKRDWNLPVYLRMGFAESTMFLKDDPDTVFLIAATSKLCGISIGNR